MLARNISRPEPAAPPSPAMDIERLRECVAGLLLDAAAFVAPARVEETARGWLARVETGAESTVQDLLLVADALGMATDLALFTPSASGQTAFDRLARQRGRMGADETAALAVLRRAQLRLLRIEIGSDTDTVPLRDLATGELLRVLDDVIGPDLAGVALVGRLAPLPDGRQVFVSGVTPLDEAAYAVAAGFVRPGARGPLPHRCAEAVYRHVVRHGTLEIPGLNRPDEDEDDGLPDNISELDLIAQCWAEPGAVYDSMIRDTSPAAQAASPERTYLAVPYAEKDDAKQLGAKWDRAEKAWFVPTGVSLEAFTPWLPAKGSVYIAVDANPAEQFAEAIRETGLQLDGLPQMDGKLHRVPVQGDKGRERSGA